MSLRQRILWLLATVTLLSCNRSTPTSQPPEPIARALAARPHRLAVVFWPQATGCASCDQLVSAVVAEWQTAPHAELAVVSVLPDRVRTTDPWLPGAIVRLKQDEYTRHAGQAPRPRVEIWSARGVLLLSRSVPNYGSQADLLTEEMLAARSFTAPIAVASGRRP
jgi:hypothetical protein